MISITLFIALSLATLATLWAIDRLKERKPTPQEKAFSELNLANLEAWQAQQAKLPTGVPPTGILVYPWKGTPDASKACMVMPDGNLCWYVVAQDC